MEVEVLESRAQTNGGYLEVQVTNQSLSLFSGVELCFRLLSYFSIGYEESKPSIDQPTGVHMQVNDNE